MDLDLVIPAHVVEPGVTKVGGIGNLSWRQLFHILSPEPYLEGLGHLVRVAIISMIRKITAVIPVMSLWSKSSDPSP